MKVAHQYFNGACEIGSYSFIPSMGTQGCTRPKDCEDLGAMCHQIWDKDDDIAACVRANSFTPKYTSTSAINTVNSDTELYQQCCGALSSSCLGNVDHYSCHWDAAEKKGAHNGPTETGVCNAKVLGADDSVCLAHTHQTRAKCLAHTDTSGNALCQWDPLQKKTAQPKIVTSGCKFALAPQVWEKTQDYRAALAWTSSRSA